MTRIDGEKCLFYNM